MVPSDTSRRLTAAIPAIEVIDLHCSVEGSRVLRGVSFGVDPGRITALIGPSGAGKTTCIRSIVGLLWPERGEVLVEGRSLLGMGKSDRLAVQKRFGVLLQGAGVYGSALWDSMTVEQNLALQLKTQCEELSGAEIAERCGRRLYEVGLTRSATLLPTELSAGMRRRLALARALVADPQFAVIDSFELGADPVTLGHLCGVVSRRHAESGGSYLVATQSMEVVRRLADNVIVLWNGRVIKEGPTDEILDAHEEEVQQLLTGSIDGPLGMAPDNVHARRVRRLPHTAPGEIGLELPVPLVAVGVLLVITASAVWLGDRQPLELAIVAVVWIVAAYLTLAWLRRRSRP